MRDARGTHDVGFLHACMFDECLYNLFLLTRLGTDDISALWTAEHDKKNEQRNKWRVSVTLEVSMHGKDTLRQLTFATDMVVLPDDWSHVGQMHKHDAPSCERYSFIKQSLSCLFSGIHMCD